MANTTCVRGCCQSDRIRLDVPRAEITLHEEIARGAESIVYRGTFEGRDVAVKRPRLPSQADLDRFHMELQLLCKIEHPSIAALLAARARPPDYSFLFRLYTGGNLADAIHERHLRPPATLLLQIAAELASALEYLHGLGILHRDVKPANVLLDEDLGVHLADFGLAAAARGLEKHTAANWKAGGKPSGGFHKRNMVGTLQYMAPEVLTREVHTEKSDVFSFGVTINEAATGVFPYSDRLADPKAHTVLEMQYGEQQLAAAIAAEGLRPVLLTPGSSTLAGLAELVQQCWHEDPGQRPPMRHVAYALRGLLVASRDSEAASLARGPPPGARESPAWHDVSQSQQGDREGDFATDSLFPSSVDGKICTPTHEGALQNGGNHAQQEVGEERAPGGQQGQGSWAAWGALAAPFPGREELSKAAAVAAGGGGAGGGYRPAVASGSFETKGGRETMEDRCFLRPELGGVPGLHAFGVFDGHRGYEAAAYAAAALPGLLATGLATNSSPAAALSAAFVECDRGLRALLDANRGSPGGGAGGGGRGLEERHPGCTAAVALLLGDTLTVANAGDCRSVLCRAGKPLALSRDHTASDREERARLVAAGSSVQWRVDTWRVGRAAIEVSRSIGDADLKPGVTAEPEVTETRLTAEDEFLIMASDGLWEMVGDGEAVAFARDTVKDAALCGKRLAMEAVERGAGDNITVVVAFLRPVTTSERVY